MERINQLRTRIRKLEQVERTEEDTARIIDLYGELYDLINELEEEEWV